jgi:hypothetical protein
MAGSDTIGPAYPCLSTALRGSRKPADDGRTGLPYYRELPALELDEGITVVGEYALRRRTEVMGKMRVPTP